MLPFAKVHIDTSAFYALIDRSDRHHNSAKKLWHQLIDNQIDMISNSFVVNETMNILQSRLGFEAAKLWFDSILSGVDVQWVDENAVQSGYLLWLTLGKMGCSMVDCISFAIMNRLKIKRAFCFKQSYSAQGFCLPTFVS